MYMDVYFRTATDGGGSMQSRRFCAAKTRVQKLTKRSIFELATDGGSSIQKRDLCYAQISPLSSCTRTYNCLTSYLQKCWKVFFPIKRKYLHTFKGLIITRKGIDMYHFWCFWYIYWLYIPKITIIGTCRNCKNCRLILNNTSLSVWKHPSFLWWKWTNRKNCKYPLFDFKTSSWSPYSLPKFIYHQK